MSYFSIFLISFTVALSGALMPGPLLAAVIYESTRHGFKTGPLFVLGHAMLEVLMVTFIILGFSRWDIDLFRREYAAFPAEPGLIPGRTPGSSR